jgi:opacity protein-like surface antigen
MKRKFFTPIIFCVLIPLISFANGGTVIPIFNSPDHCYIGGSLSGDFAQESFNEHVIWTANPFLSISPPGTIDLDRKFHLNKNLRGIDGELFAGFVYMPGMIMLGAEAFVGDAWTEGHFNRSNTYLNRVNSNTSETEQTETNFRLNYHAGARVLAGMTMWPTAQLYALVGIEEGRFKVNELTQTTAPMFDGIYPVRNILPITYYQFAKSSTGFQVGAGVSVLTWNDISVRLQYTYSVFSKLSHEAFTDGFVGNAGTTVTFDNESNSFTVRPIVHQLGLGVVYNLVWA